MHVRDVSVIEQCMREGLVAQPRYLPPWFRNFDRLNALMTHSATLNRFELAHISQFYDNIARRVTPRSPSV